MTPITLDLLFDWKISRNTSNQKFNQLIEVSEHKFIGRSELAFNIRYEESLELVQDQFSNFVNRWPNEILELSDFFQLIDSIELCSSLRCAIEWAYIDFISQFTDQSVDEFLNIPLLRSVDTSFSIPIMEVSNIKRFVSENNLNRFKSLKLKVNREQAYELTEELASCFPGKIRIDGNEAWEDASEVLNFLNQISALNIEFLEQPIKAELYEQHLLLKNNTDIKIIADENITSQTITKDLLRYFDGINIKLMKSAGPYNAIKQIKEAKSIGLEVLLGCMIESSLGISMAFHLASLADYIDLDGFLLIKNDPFKILNESGGRIFSSSLQ